MSLPSPWIIVLASNFLLLSQVVPYIPQRKENKYQQQLLINVIQLTLILKMTTPQVVEMSVTVNNNPFREYTYPDNFITFHLLMKCFSLVVFRVLEACKSWTQFLHGLTSWITWHKFLFTHQNFHHSFINPRDDRCGSIYYNEQRLYKESIWRQNYSKYGNFCNTRQRNCSEKKRDINDKENRCQWVSNNILTTYTTVL